MKPIPNREWIEEQYKNGTAQDIANLKEVSRPVVYRWLALYGIERHSIAKNARIIADRRSYEDRLRLTAKSRALITGKKRSIEDLRKRALGKQRTAKMSQYERDLFNKLMAIGFSPIPLFAVDKFNIDLAFPDRKIGIEVDGGNWHKTARRKMAQDNSKSLLLDSMGWRIIRISTRRKDWLTVALEIIMPILH